MAFLDRVLGKLNAQKQEQSTSTTDDYREMADISRKSGENLLSKLETLKFENPNRKLTQEQLADLAKIVEAMKAKIRNAPMMTIDTRMMDNAMMDLVDSFQDAIKNGYKEAASTICELLAKGLTEDRVSISLDKDEVEREWILEQRNSKMQKWKTLVEFCMMTAKLRDELGKIDQAIEGDREKYYKAKEELDRMKKARPDLVEKMKKIPTLGPGEMVDPDVMILSDKTKSTVIIYNGIKQKKQIKGIKEQHMVTLEESLTTLNNQILNEANMLNPRLVENMEQFKTQLQKELLQEREDTKSLSQSSAQIQAAYDDFFMNKELVDSIVETMMDFNDIEKRMQAEEEGRKRAQEQQLQEELEQEAAGNLLTH